MAHAQKPDSVFQRNGRVHLYRRGCQFSRVLAFLECGSGENDCSNTGRTVPSQTEACLATHSIRFFPLHFSTRASPCATRFRFHSTRFSEKSYVQCTIWGRQGSSLLFSKSTSSVVLRSFFLHCVTLKMRALKSSEVPVATYRSAQFTNRHHFDRQLYLCNHLMGGGLLFW